MEPSLELILAVSVGLLGLVWFIVRRRAQSSNSGNTEAAAAATVAAKSSQESIRCPVTSTTSNSRSQNSETELHTTPNDPIHEFADGDRKKSPIMCPFMAAFQAERKAADGEGKEEEADVALQDLKSLLSDYEKYRDKKAEEAKKQQEQDDLDSSCNSVVGHIKRLEQEKLILQLTDEEMEAEQRARDSQLAEIYALMREQQEKFGIGSVNEVQKQMRLYVS